MEGRELQHFFHKHLLILKVEQSKTNGANNHPEAEIKCDGCRIPISGPFYSCGECQYFLHKVCAELPSELDYPQHPQHPLTLNERSPYRDAYKCDSCGESGSEFVYHCSECSFDLDMICASASHKINDKCHPHPLTPIQIPITFVCHICRKKEEGLSYKCYSCPFWVHQNCALKGDTFEHSHPEDPYPFVKLQHFSHDHLLILLANERKTEDDFSNAKLECYGCKIQILGPFYSCRECRYFLHKVCAELPSELDYPQHPQHPLTLIDRSPHRECDSCGESGSEFVYRCSECSFDLDMKCAWATQKIKDKCHPHPLTPLQVLITFICHICRKKEEGLSYKCYSCPFWVHQNCTLKADTFEHSHLEDPYPFLKLQHFSHDHPLILLANERKTEDDYWNVKLECYGCRTQILGPFYSCGECRYFLHKLCAELPSALDHPLHPQHLLTLLTRSTKDFKCSLCRETGSGLMGCSKCSFYVDVKCASATHVIQDKCHPHPLTPSQVPISFFCHICLVEEKGLSYRCNICPFWVHQNCTLLHNTAKHSYHGHLLKFFPTIPFEFSKYSTYCDICHTKLFMFQGIYGCDRCLFFAHVSCARSEIVQSPSTSGDQNTEGQSVVRLPMKQDSTDLISEFVRNYIDEDAEIYDKINHFDHEHPLSLIDEKTNDNKICEACAIPISAPSYGCVDCNYFLHKCCTDLPKQIRHPLHPDHQLSLRSMQHFIRCQCCLQWCNSFSYECPECEFFGMDIKCASSILEGTVVYHEAHKHPLITQIINTSSSFCTVCGYDDNYMLECNTCSFVLCFRCAMAPPVIKHRYGKSEPFRLTYSPPENHYEEYLCELCLKELNPKLWYYHCAFADQFTHTSCMIYYGADSNIKYGKKSQMFEEGHEEHELTTISATYDCSPCGLCRHPMGTGFAAGCVGFECKTCNFRRHLGCPRR